MESLCFQKRIAFVVYKFELLGRIKGSAGYVNLFTALFRCSDLPR
jgi:hypothetical protein